MGQVIAHRLGDLGQIAHPRRRHDGGGGRGETLLRFGQAAVALLEALGGQRVEQAVIERGDAVIIEARGDGTEHRHRRRIDAEHFAVALHLLAHVAQRVEPALGSNLLIATRSAWSSMSIFSSWLAAPNSGVITYMARSAISLTAESPWPMPGVSTITSS